MTVTTPAALLGPLIDDTILWFTCWHRLAFATAETREMALPLLDPPGSFIRWRDSALKDMPQEQPAIEKLIALHDQMHTLARLVLQKSPEATSLDGTDDENVTTKYLELMQGLRRLERAFAAAASELDPLTGLQTRTGLLRDLDREIKRYNRTKRPFCIAIMDIDHFKRVNDSYGHDIGDKVLVAVANHISRTLRAHDDAYRLGGEEFMLCLKEADLAGGIKILDRLRTTLEENPVTFPEGVKLPVTASFGLTEVAEHSTAADLLKRADEALYRAKDKGRNRVVIG